MAFQVNELSEAIFTEQDIKEYLSRSSLGSVIAETFVTQDQLAKFSSSDGSFVHDGVVFSSDVESLKHAIEYTHTRTAIVNNGFENFQKGLTSENPNFFANIVSRGNGLASINLVVFGDSVEAGENFGALENFVVGGKAFVRGVEYTATGSNKVTVDGVEYDLPLGKFGKSLPKTSTYKYPGGSVLFIEATPLAGYTFKEWKGEDPSTEASRTIVLEHNLYLEATFA